jgi:hypothetical protein
VRTRGFTPALHDSEVLTIEIVGEFLGFDQDARLFWYFRQASRQCLPATPSHPPDHLPPPSRQSMGRQAASAGVPGRSTRRQ